MKKNPLMDAKTHFFSMLLEFDCQIIFSLPKKNEVNCLRFEFLAFKQFLNPSKFHNMTEIIIIVKIFL